MYVERASLGLYGLDCCVDNRVSLGDRYVRGRLGEAPSAAKVAEFKVTFAAKYNELRTMIIWANATSTHPVPAATMDANLASMDRVAAKIQAGEYDKAPGLINTARGILVAVGMSTPTVTLEGVLRAIQDLPRQFGLAVVAVTTTAGEAAGGAARGAGLDPTKALEETSSTIKWVAGAGVVLGGAYIIYKLL